MDQFTADGLTFPVRDTAPTASRNGETVVLLHGFPEASSSWEKLTPTLTAAGYRVLAPDQRGYATTALPAGRSAYRMAKLVADVLALLDAAGVGRVHLVGHDWGGAVAWAVAAQAPERLLSLCVLSTPHPSAAVRAAVRSAQALRSSYMLFFQLPWLPEQLIDPSRPGGRSRLVRLLVASGLDRPSAERDADELAKPGVMTGALNWYRAVPLTGRIGSVSVPTLYVWGRRDQALGRTAAEGTARFVTGPYTFRELDADHWITGEVGDILLPHLQTNGLASLVA